MEFEYRPKTSIAMQYQSEVAILGLVKRLKEYARKPEFSEFYCDLDMAANLLDEFLRSSDDYK